MTKNTIATSEDNTHGAMVDDSVVDDSLVVDTPPQQQSREIGAPKGVAKGAEPTRYGDWEVNGRCSDF